MNLQTLTNIRQLLNRVTVTGPEAVAWVQTAQAVEAEIARLSKTNGHAQPPIDNAHVAPGCEQFAEAPQ